jgi:hypothetical protein
MHGVYPLTRAVFLAVSARSAHLTAEVTGPSWSNIPPDKVSEDRVEGQCVQRKSNSACE